MTISIDKKERTIYLFFLFLIGLIVIRHRFSATLGEFSLAVESITIILLAFFSRENTKIKSKIFFVYLILSVGRFMINYLLNGGLNAEAQRIIYREIGVFVIAYLVLSKETGVKLVLLFRNIGIMNSVLGCIEYLMHRSVFNGLYPDDKMIFMKYTLGTSDWRVRTCFVHPIICAAFVTTTWIILIYYPLKDRIANFVSMLILVFCLIATKSRSSWISFALVNVFIIAKTILKKRKYIQRRSLYLIALILIFTIPLIVVFWEQTRGMVDMVIERWLLGMDSKNAGNYNRITMIKIGIRDWNKSSTLRKTLGHGAGYALALLRAHSIRGWDTAVDNSYITILLNYGAVALTIFIAVLIVAMYRFIVSRSRMIEMAALCVISIYVSGFFYDIFGWISVNIYLGLLLILQEFPFDYEDYGTS